MIKITAVEEKMTRTQKPYKRLSLVDGKSVSMWEDDTMWDIAVAGAELNRDVEQNGQYWNLLPEGGAPSQSHSQAQNGDLGEVLRVLGLIADHLKIDITKPEPEVVAVTPEVEYPDIEINPDDIPF